MITMQFIRVDLSVYETQLQALNDYYITTLPQGSVTSNYANSQIVNGFGYVVKDSLTEQYFTDYIDFVDSIPILWHEDKAVQIIQNKSGVIWGAMNEPEIAMALAIHRRDNNMVTYEEGDQLYFYANTILPEHQAIFDAYPQLETTVNHAEN